VLVFEQVGTQQHEWRGEELIFHHNGNASDG
jgi:hypothetical protein